MWVTQPRLVRLKCLEESWDLPSIWHRGKEKPVPGELHGAVERWSCPATHPVSDAPIAWCFPHCLSQQPAGQALLREVPWLHRQGHQSLEARGVCAKLPEWRRAEVGLEPCDHDSCCTDHSAPHPGGNGDGTQVPEGPAAQSALSGSWSLVCFATREHHPRSICGLNRLFVLL